MNSGHQTLQKNRFSIVVTLALFVLIGWSIYLAQLQLDERKQLEKLDVHIQHYRHVSQVIHAMQEERKMAIALNLSLLDVTAEAFRDSVRHTDERVAACMGYMRANGLRPSKGNKLDRLAEIRNLTSRDESANMQLCDAYSEIIRSMLFELSTIYKKTPDIEVQQRILLHMLLASMHEAMTQVDQAVSIAIANEQFLGREHYRFFNNAIFTAKRRKDDFKMLADAEQIKWLLQKQQSPEHRELYKIQKYLLQNTPQTKLLLDLETWNSNFTAVNAMQENLELLSLSSIDELTHSKIDEKNNELYFFMGLNLLVSSLIILAFTMIRYLYYEQYRQRASLNTLKNAVENSDNNIIITDVDHHITYVNRAFEETSGYRRDEVIGETPRFLQSGEHDQAYYDRIKETIASGKTWLGEFINKHKNGSLFYEKASISPLINDEGVIEGFIAMKLDITKEHEYQQLIEEKNLETEYRYFYDPLTGLANRNKMIEDIQEMSHPTVLLLNINDFKAINAYYGIDMGDLVLQQMGKLLDEISKKYRFTHYRLHADEFALLCQNERDRLEMDTIVRTIKYGIAAFEFGSREHDLLVFVTMGITMCERERPLPALLLKQADIALQYAKLSRNYYAYYADAVEMEATFEKNLVWTRKISHAIQKRQIQPYMQPIFDARGNIYAYEGLARLVDDDKTVIAPGAFLEIAKHSKLYPKITMLMCEQVFQSFSGRDEAFTINISYEDISTQQIVDYILDGIDKYGVGERLIFEILESESIENYDDITAFIALVKTRGCRIAIDDFGSGYSNFERILRFDIDYIKIDGSIIKAIDTDPNSKIIAETIVSFAKRSGIELVAEYVCSESVNAAVETLGIEYRQGYHLGKPQPLPLLT